MIYQLVWNNEVIDTATTKFQAISLQREYSIAFNDSNIQIIKVRA